MANLKFTGILFFVLLLFLSTRGYLQADGQIGHNWDYSFPDLDFLYDNLRRTSWYTWWDFNLGQSNPLILVHLVPNLFLSGLVGLFGAIWGVKVLLITLISLSVLGMYRLILREVKDGWVSFWGAILYGFSPFFFNDIIGGSWYMWLSYTFLPYFLILIHRRLERPNTLDFISYLFLCLLILPSLQYFVLIHFVSLLYIFLFGLREGRPWYFFKRFLCFIPLLVLSNLYWILPAFLTFTSYIGGVFSTAGTSDVFGHVASNNQTILNILNLSGYLDRNMYSYLFNDVVWLVITTLIVFSWIIVVLRVVRAKKWSFITWLVIYSLSVLLVKGGNPPFTDLTLWLFRTLPFMSIFRSPQHLMVLPALLTPLVLTAAISDSKVNQRVRRYGFPLLVLIWTSGWFLAGDFGSSILGAKGRDHLDFFRLSPEMVKVIQTSENDPLDHRILFLPSVLSPQFLANEYQGQAQGGQPEYAYLRHPTFTSEWTNQAAEIENYFCGLSDENPIEKITKTNVLYIAVRRDIAPKFTECAKQWDIAEVGRKVENLPGLTKVFSAKYADLYKVNPDVFKPVIHLETGEGQANYRKINPTKYDIEIKTGEEEISLIFLSNFNPLWRLYHNKVPLVNYTTHEKLENWTNSWRINTEALCNDTNCGREGDKYLINLTLEFYPQRYMYLGLFISIVTFLVVLGLSIYHHISRKKRHS